MMKLAGIDYSLRCPCVCVFEGTNYFHYSLCKFYYLIDSKKYIINESNINGFLVPEYTSDIERYDLLSNWTMKYLNDCDQIAIEGYSMGSKGKTFNIAENVAVLKYKMYLNKFDFISIPPTTVKKFACKGNADKDLMYSVFKKETKENLKKIFSYGPSKIGNPISDIVDSYYITKFLFNKRYLNVKKEK